MKKETMDNKIKAVFLDVDGTLISFENHKIPRSAIDALTLAHQNGVRLVIATGRVWTDLRDLEEIPYDAVVSLNGAQCVLRDGTEISAKQIAWEDYVKVRDFAREHGFPIALEVEKGILVNMVNDSVVSLAKMIAHPIPPVVDTDKEFRECHCCQLCLYCDEELEKQMMAGLPGLTVSRWNPHFADINVSGVDKAMGMKDIADYYGFDIAETMAFGDGANDIPMLRSAGIGIAMGTAADSVKIHADYVTGSVDEDGIRSALLHFGLV